MRKRYARTIGVTIAMGALVGALLTPSVAVAATRTFSSQVDAAGDRWEQHVFDVGAAGPIEASLDWSTTSANLNLFLFRKDGGSWTRVALSTTSARPEVISFADGTPGQWKVGIKAVSGASTYEVMVTYEGGSTVVVPGYVDTIGGGAEGHADMYPSGLDVDASGNVYVADTGNDRIQKLRSDGTRAWAVGTRGAKAPGRFKNPRDVAFLAGKVYVADTGFNRVQVLDASNGSLVSVWPTRFGTIMGISAGVDGNGSAVILVSESSANTIRVYTPGGTLLRSVGSGPGDGPAQLDGVRDAATDAQGNIYAADYANSRVVVFGPLGGALRTWGVNGTAPGELKRPYGIDLDASAGVYVADSNNRIHRFTDEGTFVRSYGEPGTGPGRFEMLRRVALGPGTNPIVHGADLWTYRIERFESSGAYRDTFGGEPPAEGSFNEPYGFAVDTQQLFVADMVNQRAQRFAATGAYGFQLAWGERGWGEGNPGFNWPRDVALATNGGSKSVWVADTKNNRFTEFWPDGTPTGRRFGSRGSAVGQLLWPHAAVGVGSDLIVADTKNHRIQRWDPTGPSVEWSTSIAAGTSFASPKDVSVSGGRVYVADTANLRVVVLDAATGTYVRQYAGTALHRVEGVAVEPNGDVWVADTSWNRLVELSSAGSVLQTFGGLGSSNVRFNKPTHLEIQVKDGQVRLLVVDSWNDRIQVFDVD